MVWGLLVGIGIIALVSSGKWFKSFVQPGPANFQHAFITQCDACHVRAASNISSLLAMGVEGFRLDSKDPGRKCLQCHVGGQEAFDPHGLDSARPGLESGQPNLVGVLAGGVREEVACATCHSIHQQTPGAGTRSLDDGQCQVCHRSRHTAFAIDHPEFTDLPAYTPQLLFDHNRHVAEHFSKRGLSDFAPANCEACHQMGTAGLALTGFDQMCADCHLRTDIIEKNLDSIGPTSLVAIPRMDSENLAIGYWPNCRTSRFKRLGDMPPLMRRMLETDPVAVAAIEVLEQNGTTLSSMKDASAEEFVAATRLAWSIKALVADIAADDAAVRFSPESKTREVAGRRLSELVSLVPMDVRRRLAEYWFPTLASELTGMDEALPGQCPDRTDWSAMRNFIEKRKRNLGANPGWYLQAKSSYMALSYVPQRHQDPLMLVIAALLADKAEADTEFQCAKCHGPETSGKGLVVKWPTSASNRKTRFSHVTHLASGSSCDACHRPGEAVEQSAIARTDHLPIEIGQCSECHDGDSARQACVVCHEYHGQPFMTRPSANALQVATPP